MHERWKLRAVQQLLPALELARGTLSTCSGGWPETAVMVRGRFKGLFPLLVKSVDLAGSGTSVPQSVFLGLSGLVKLSTAS